MIFRNFLLLVFTSICGLAVSAEKTDTTHRSLPFDTAFVRAIGYDSKTYTQFKEKKQYNYYRTVPQGDSLLDIIRRFLHRYILAPIAGSHTANWIIFVAVVAIIGLILFFFRPAWFYINIKKKIEFSLENENIHELDFNRLIKDALKLEQYATAIRWNYLQLLKTLHAKKIISWDAHKTVIEYVYEIRQPVLKSNFKEVSQQFLYYRYGNFEASQENWETFTALTHKISSEL